MTLKKNDSLSIIQGLEILTTKGKAIVLANKKEHYMITGSHPFVQNGKLLKTKKFVILAFENKNSSLNLVYKDLSEREYRNIYMRIL